MKPAAILLIFLMLVDIARCATVTTLDGKTFDGAVTFDANGTLTVQSKKGTTDRIDLDNVLQVNLATGNFQLLRGVLLTSGEMISADAITHLDTDGVRLVRAGGVAISIPATDIAVVFFRPASASMLKHVPAGHAGAILDNGDFFEGDFAGFDGKQIKISSVLFGIESFDINHQARAVILQDALSPKADQIVRTTDGSLLLAKSVAIQDGKLTVDDARLGSVVLDIQNIAGITVGGDAFQSLSTLAPAKTDGDGFAMDATTAGVPMSLLGISPTHGIGQRPGVSLTWDLSGKYKSVIAKAGVPLGITPIQHLQFVVIADGKEVFRTPPRSSIDTPAAIAVQTANVKLLTLRVEGSAPDAPGAAGLWADPILVRAQK